MPSRITGPSNAGSLASVQTRDIDALVIVMLRAGDDPKPYDVYGYVPSGTSVRVAGPFTEAEAVAYVTNDPDGLL